MKKWMFILLTISTLSTLQAQDRRNRYYPPKYNVVKINPLSLVLANLSVSYERFITDKISFQLQGGYWMGFKIKNTDWKGISFTPELRYYITENERPEGLYGAVFGRYQQITGSLQNSETEVKISRSGGGIAVGYQLLLGKRVTGDLFAGPQYLLYSVDKVGSSDIDYGKFISNFGIRVGATVGVAF